MRQVRDKRGKTKFIIRGHKQKDAGANVFKAAGKTNNGKRRAGQKNHPTKEKKKGSNVGANDAGTAY